MTRIFVYNGEKEFVFEFEFPKDTLEFMFHNQVNAVGYFTAVTKNGNSIVINPSHCGVIEII